MQKETDRPIGIFDSGVGGLSVLKEMRKLLPNENFVFLADQLHIPYGEKNSKQLIDLAYRITDYFIRNHDVKMIVVACNTSTCYSVDALRKKYSLPIVGTVPAVKVAADMTKSGTIAVISTSATSKSIVLKNLIRDFSKNLTVLNIGCPNLEDIVEKGDLHGKKVHILLGKYLKQIVNSDADQLVLGCTHYPFLRKSIEDIVGSKVNIIDSGTAIAKQTQALLKKYKIKNNQKGEGQVSYFTTDNAVKFSKVIKSLLEQKVQAKKVAI